MCKKLNIITWKIIKIEDNEFQNNKIEDNRIEDNKIDDRNEGNTSKTVDYCFSENL